MSDIFISYARSTADQARRVAEALRGLGYGVWRDDEIPANRAYADVIAERLANAKAVVVIWSAEAAKSEWVRSEAEKARASHKLVQLRLDAADLPMPFDQTQCADLQGWSGEDGPGWRQVVGAIANLASPGRPGVEAARIAAAPRLSICVLPFTNISDDPQQEYFSDGISEDIITDLSKVSALGVIARNTAFGFKGKSPNVKEVARELGVSHVLEGSVRKAGNRVRITAQLIDGASGEHAWAERFDRDLDDIFALQDEISRAIVAALKVKLLPEEKKAIAKRGTDNVDAYNLVLMARNLRMGNLSAQNYETIERIADRAIALDPNYAEAWVTKGRAQFNLVRRLGKTGDDGSAAAARALELDPNLAEAHAFKAKHLDELGRKDEALAELELALRLDPSSFEVTYTAGTIHYDNRRLDLAAQYCEAAVKLDDTDFRSAFFLVGLYGALNQPEKAREAAAIALSRAEKVVEQDRANGMAMSVVVNALAALGEAGRARAWMDQAVLLDPDNDAMHYNFACALSRDLGDVDGALEFLGLAIAKDRADVNFRIAKDDPDFDSIRGDPRFQALIAEAEARLTKAAGV